MLSVEVGRRSTCVVGFPAIDGARAPTCQLLYWSAVCGQCVVNRYSTYVLTASEQISHRPAYPAVRLLSTNQNSCYLYGRLDTSALPLSSTTCSARTLPSSILRHRPPVTRFHLILSASDLTGHHQIFTVYVFFTCSDTPQGVGGWVQTPRAFERLETTFCPFWKPLFFNGNLFSLDITCVW